MPSGVPRYPTLGRHSPPLGKLTHAQPCFRISAEFDLREHTLLSDSAPPRAAELPRRPSLRRGHPSASTRLDRFLRWRDAKLRAWERWRADPWVELVDPGHLSGAERAALLARVQDANMVLYACRRPGQVTPSCLRQLGAQLGLRRVDPTPYADADGLSALRVGGGGEHEYIPYTDRRLSWHTDGYYNDPAHPVRAFVLHCAQAAAHGGESWLLDHELACLMLRDVDAGHLDALAQPDAMTIPANVRDGLELRPERRGPVLSSDPHSGRLHMRYTARKRFVIWSPRPEVQAAAACLDELLSASSSFVLRHRLEAGEGLVCNNVLHARSAFCDDRDSGSSRLVYRARYLEPVAAATPAMALAS